MIKFIKGFSVGLAVTTLVGGTIAIAKNSQETITASYQNIKLVVDGVYVEPKDGNGNVVEPFIYDGTTYLPVRAVGEAFKKEVFWDGATATVDLHTPGEPEKKAVDLYDRPYAECGDANNLRSYTEKGVSYIYCYPSSNKEKIDDRYSYDNYVTYDLKGKATNFTGEFYLTGDENTEGVLKIKSGGKVIYTSPIMRNTTSPVSIDIPLDGADNVTFVFEATCEYGGDYRRLYIKNPKITTSDY